MILFTDEGIVLQKRLTGEKNEIVTILTKVQGKITLLAYGSRDPKSRKAGALQCGNSIEFQIRRSKQHLPSIQQVKVLCSHRSFFFDGKKLERYGKAMEMLCFTDEWIKEAQLIPELYETLFWALDHCDQPLIGSLYTLSLLTKAGFLPEFSRCTHCAVKLNLQETIGFSTEDRGFAHQEIDVCQKAPDRGKPRSLIPVDQRTVKAMAYFQKAQMEESLKVQLSRESLLEIQSLVDLMAIN